jgi:hypothetical protein
MCFFSLFYRIDYFCQALTGELWRITWSKRLLAIGRKMAYRLGHLSGIRSHIEQSAREIVASASNEYSETRANWFIDLSRAVLPVSRDDAAAYFNFAVESVRVLTYPQINEYLLGEFTHFPGERVIQCREDTHFPGELTHFPGERVNQRDKDTHFPGDQLN